MYSEIHEDYNAYGEQLKKVVRDFDPSGEILVKGKRNTIKTFELAGLTVNVKSFRIPNPVNRVVYRNFRKSKAARSYWFARRLLELGISTPQPLAYFEERSPLTIRRSYYISEHLGDGYTFKALLHSEDFPDRENILRQFARFTFQMHEKNIWFLDHSPGNTIIQPAEDGRYNFFLVDLNRMQFRKLDDRMRIQNFSRLSATPEILEIMATEYARISEWPVKTTIEGFIAADQRFRNRKNTKKRWKKILHIR